MRLTDGQHNIFKRIRSSRRKDFATLAKLARLDPKKDFLSANLSGVDFGKAVLAGFNFTGADLRGADFRGAAIGGAIFKDADLSGALWPQPRGKKVTVRQGEGEGQQKKYPNFHDLLRWHLENGSRPDGQPGSVGKMWGNKEFAAAVLVSDRTVRGWRKGTTRPSDLMSIERSLFGANPAYSDARRELREAYSARPLPSLWPGRPLELSSNARSTIFLGQYGLDGSGGTLTYEGERNLLLFGPTGSGKTARILIPNLLSIETQSIITIDINGECAAVTSEYRRTIGDVFTIDPFDLLGKGSAGFNPLIALSPESPTFYDDALAIGEALIKNEGADPFWNDGARSLLVALVMWVKIRDGEHATLETVRTLLTEPQKSAEETDNPSTQTSGIDALMATMIAEGPIEIKSLAQQFINMDRRTAHSIIMTASMQMDWILSRPISADLRKRGFDFFSLKKRPSTLYIVLPASYIATHAGWLRLIVASALRALCRPGGARVLLILDEFAALGQSQSVESALAVAHGYGVQLWMLLQDLSQLKAVYKDRWESFIANSGVVQAFGPNDYATAEWMSRRAGETTAIVMNHNRPSNPSSEQDDPTSQSENASAPQAQSLTISTRELLGMKDGTGLLWLAGLAETMPFCAPGYWQTRRFYQRASHRSPSPAQSHKPIEDVRTRLGRDSHDKS